MSDNEQVIVYSKPGCGPCLVTKRFLSLNKIDFTELTQEDAFAKGYRSVPVITYKDSVIIGSDIEKLNKLKDEYFGTV